MAFSIPSPFSQLTAGPTKPAGPAKPPPINFRTGAGERYAPQTQSPEFQAGHAHGRALATAHASAAAQKPPPRAAPNKTNPSQRAPKPGRDATPAGGGGITLNQILAAARASASSDTNAAVAPLLAQQNLAHSQATAQAQQYQAAAQAAAQYLQGMGDTTSKSYQNAATTLAGLASGYAGQLNTDATNAAATQQQALASLGAPAGSLTTPTGQTVQPQALQNVLYGLGGAIPANLLVTSGEAAAAAQRRLPATLIGQGLQQGQTAITQGNTTAANLIPQIEAIKAGQPKLVQQYLTQIETQIRDTQLANSLIGSRQASASLAQNKFTFTQNEAKVKDALAQSRLTLAQWKAAHPNASAGSKPSSSITGKINDGFLHNADGTKTMINGKPVPVKPTTKGPTVTATRNEAKALGDARHFHQPYVGKDGKRHGGLTWQEFLTYEEQKGIDPKTAIKMGKKIYSQAEIKQGLYPPGSSGLLDPYGNKIP